MISFRIGLLSTVLTLGLTACGNSIAPFPGFNSGPAKQDYHALLLGASAAGQQTYDRDGRLIAVSGPLADREDLPLEAVAPASDRLELAARLDTLPIPAIRPIQRAPEPALQDDADEAGIQILSQAALDALDAVVQVRGPSETDAVPTLRETPLLVPDTEAALASEPAFDTAASIAAPAVTPAAFQPDPPVAALDPTAGLSLLGSSTTTLQAPLAATQPQSAISEVLDQLTTTAPVDTPELQADAPVSELQADILALNDEELDILLVQLEDDKSGLERVRNMTPEEKARLRQQYEKRSFLGHFAKMDRGNDGALTREEMLAYFTIMHAAFDADYDDVVTRAEAPTLLLRIKLLGRGFPEEGLTLEELSARLEETFVFLDRNKNNKLGWPELL